MELPEKEINDIQPEDVKKALDKLVLQEKATELLKKLVAEGKTYDEIRKELDALYDKND